MGWRDRLLNASPDTVGRALKFGGGRILSQQDMVRPGMNKGGRAAKNIGGRANLLEEMGRIDARRHPDAADRAEKHRVIGELNRGYKKGGDVYKPSAADKKYSKYLDKKHPGVKRLIKTPANLKRLGKADGGRVAAKQGYFAREDESIGMRLGKGKACKKERDLSYGKWGHRGRDWKKSGGKVSRLDNMTINKKGQPLATRVKMKKGGDGKWIQKVDASIKRRGTKGKCTPITKPGCTGRAKALAKTFKKMAAKRKKS